MWGRDLAPGEVVDGLRLESRVHVGGMSVLWRVSREDVPFPIIMKIPLLRYGEDPATIVGFEIEQMILPRLTGIHAPRFVQAGDFERPYIAMEFVDGQSLYERLKDLPLDPAETASIGARVATALHDLHRQHVLHLDVKPSNIVVRPSGAVTLIDFGLSHHEQLPDLLAEEFHMPIGTGPYISPEQLQDNRNDPRSDLFALGALLYFFVTGVRPFGDPATIRGWRRRLYRNPVPPRALRPDLPAWMQEIILRCLELDPEDRHGTAAQLAFDLQHPEKVRLTARAERRQRDRFLTVARRWLAARQPKLPHTATISRQLAKAPIVMAAIDLSPGMEPLAEQLRLAVRRVLLTEPEARLACVNVLKGSHITIDKYEDEQGRNLHLLRLAELKHWAHPLALPPDRVTFHVLEAVDPPGALVEYARTNHVDQIVMGARASSSLRQYLGSVSSRVVAEAPCTVTVVRARESREHPDTQSSGPETASAAT